MDRQQVTGLTLLDLSAAFDTINHSTIQYHSGWLQTSPLSISKTEFLIIGLPTQLSKLHMPNLILPDNSSITPVKSARNLGIIFNSYLSYDKHI